MENKKNIFVNVNHGNELYSLESEGGNVFSGYFYDLDLAKKDLEEKFFKMFPAEKTEEIVFVYRPTIFKVEADFGPEIVNNIEVDLSEKEEKEIHSIDGEIDQSEKDIKTERSPGDKLFNCIEISQAGIEQVKELNKKIIALYDYIDAIPIIGDNTARWKALAKTALEQSHDAAAKALSIVR